MLDVNRLRQQSQVGYEQRKNVNSFLFIDIKNTVCHQIVCSCSFSPEIPNLNFQFQLKLETLQSIPFNSFLGIGSKFQSLDAAFLTSFAIGMDGSRSW